MDLKHWELADDVDCPFPKLERLVLRNCFELKEMPSWIENLSNLKSVRLEHCHDSLVSSARMIEEEQRENYGEEYGFEIVEFHTQSDQKNGGKLKNMYFRFWNYIHSTLTQVSLPLCHSFAEENDEDINMSVFLKVGSISKNSVGLGTPDTRLQYFGAIAGSRSKYSWKLGTCSKSLLTLHTLFLNFN
ncbi:putative late blight resistance protein homolog R1B-12 isoform X2 [Ipomoea triloba]|uniref:putative late blight resistance protein homolog R1B-12 isoform X2 n=1 Tax=Ipomoea triloba TaxID=35885 RepID=UPI00125E719B|nr:putative late blight resistance protein homolog R1B-12 isoform X2 [Ipomoea triloba]